MTKQPEPTQRKMDACPATIALEHALVLLDQSLKNLGKRRRQEKDRKCVFDMEQLVQETSAVEQTFDFPLIEWQFTDETMSSKNESSVGTNVENGLKPLLRTENKWMETGFGELRRKRRRCNRLVRCRRFSSFPPSKRADKGKE
jgi:hypothetical protein